MKKKSNTYIMLSLLIGMICLATRAVAQDKQHPFLCFKDTRLGVRFETNIDNDSKFETNDANLKLKEMHNTNLLLELEGVIAKSKRAESAIVLGAGGSRISIANDYIAPMYSFTTNQDIDGDTYTREYHDLKMCQKSVGYSFTMSLAFRERLRLYKDFGLYADLGMNGMMLTSMKMDDMYGDANVKGRYGQYGDIVLDGAWGNNGFGMTYLRNANTTKDIKVNSFVPVPFVRLGLDWKFSTKIKSGWITLGATYQSAMDDLLKYNENNGVTDSDNAIVYNTMNGTESKENVRSVLGSYSKSRLRGIMINFGVYLFF